MTQLTQTITLPTLQDLSLAHGNSPQIFKAIAMNMFYVVATPVGNTVCIGRIDDNVPALLPTLDEAQADLKDLLDYHLESFADGDIDEDEECDAHILKATWNGSELIHFYTPDGDVCDDASFLFSDTVSCVTGA